MDRQTNTRAYNDDSRFVLQIIEGGTGATNPHDACVNLNAISMQDRGQPNGIASLSNNRKVLLSELPYLPGVEEPSIDWGNTSISNYTIAEFTITNYDTQTNYVITANHGQLFRIDDKIYYACNNYVGIDVIQVNAKVFGVNVVSGTDTNKPVIVTPINNGTILADQTWVVNPTANISNHNVITSVHWEVTRIIDNEQISIDTGTSLIFDPTELLVNQYALIAGDHYTLRCRIDTLLLGISQFSDPVTFTIGPVPINNDVIIYDDTDNSYVFDGINYYTEINRAYNIVLSKDGSTLVASYNGKNCVEVYKKVNNVWSLVSTDIAFSSINNNLLPANVVPEQGVFGMKGLAVSHTGERIYIADPDANNTNLNSLVSLIYVFKATDASHNTYAMESCISPEVYVGPHFGERIFLSADSSKLFIQTQINDLGTDMQYHGIDVYSCNNGIHTYINRINNITVGEIERLEFGRSISISDDGNRVVISDDFITVGINTGAGKIYIIDNINNIWTLTETLTVPNHIDLNTYFGSMVALSGDGNTIVALHVDYNTGYYYLSAYNYINNAWVYSTTYTEPLWNSLGWPYTNNLVLNYTGDVLFVGCDDSMPPPVLKHPVVTLNYSCGMVWCYSLLPNEFNLITYYHGDTYDLFGNAITYNDTTHELFIAAGNRNVGNRIVNNNIKFNAGTIYHYK